MGNYASVADMLERLPKLDATTVTSAQLNVFLRDAEAEVDAKLAKRYATPVSGSPPILNNISATLALGRVLTMRVFTGGALDDSDWPDKFVEDARDLLDALADGSATIVTSAGSEVAGRTDVSEMWSSTKGYQPTNTERGPLRDSIDPDKVDDLDDARE